MLAEGVELLLREIPAVIATDMIEILGILPKEADEIGVFPDRLPRKSEVILAEVEAVDVIMAAAHVIIFARILPTQHEIVEDHQILSIGIELAGIWHVFAMLEEERFDATRLAWRRQSIHHVDQRVRAPTFDGEEIADIRLEESFSQCPLQQLVDGLVERFSEDVKAIVVEPSRS